MNTIKLLDKQTIDKIAAGEVIDRPASIVKELVENAIDAGATSISIEIKDGGISLVRITDNGVGIPKDQIAIAFLRHSTSKIQDASDLAFIHTLGFRGEALSSIAAVSQTELCTKTKDSLTGIIYKINGGEEESLSEAGLPNGTTLIVRNLFYNTPARLKFLKSPQTEAAYVLDIVQKIALSRPDIAFKFTSNGSVRISTSGNGSLKDAVYAVFGRDIANNLLEINTGNETLSIYGFIGKPEIARGNRSFEFFFLNGRYIKDRIIQKALEDAFTGYQMKGTFPFCVLNVQIEPELVDVNVHPSKMEIRFFNNEVIYNCVYDIIRDRISKRENIPEVSLKTEKSEEPETKLLKKENSYIPEPFETKAIENISQSIPSSGSEKNNNIQFVNEPSLYHTEITSFNEKETDERKNESFKQEELFDTKFLSEEAKAKHRIIGVIFDTYWMVEFEDKLFIIDQHAAHEKVLYEKFMKQLKEGRHYSQQLMPSIIVTLNSQEEACLKKFLDQFLSIGFEISNFGGSEYAISAVPTDLYSIDNKVLFLELLNELSEFSLKAEPDILTDRVATAACKAAVKGGNKLSFTEADHLISELLSLENPYNCPHGRPTIISMSKYELEKKFKRII